MSMNLLKNLYMSFCGLLVFFECTLRLNVHFVSLSIKEHELEHAQKVNQPVKALLRSFLDF